MYGVYKSEDNGESWNPAKTGLVHPVSNFTIDSNGNIYGATNFGGTYFSDNNGENWSQQNDGITIKHITCLAANKTGQVFAGSWGSAIFRCDATTSVLMQSDKLTTSNKIILAQNYPNPFNPMTNISFQISKLSDIEINIYNIKGQLIKNLFKGKKSSGYHTISWNAAGLPCGTYFIKLKTTEYMNILKCILLK